MALTGNYKSIRNVWIIDAVQRQEICTYLKGMVYAWCATKGTEPFAAREILGNVNYDWTNTPMQPLYTHYIWQGYAECQELDTYLQSDETTGILKAGICLLLDRKELFDKLFNSLQENEQVEMKNYPIWKFKNW